jgi:hypothetical protein
MIHRSGWRDPLKELDWEDIFYGMHPLPEVALLPLLWESLSDTAALPQSSRILSLSDLAIASDRCKGIVGRRAVREAHLHFSVIHQSQTGAT